MSNASGVDRDRIGRRPQPRRPHPSQSVVETLPVSQQVPPLAGRIAAQIAISAGGREPVRFRNWPALQWQPSHATARGLGNALRLSRIVRYRSGPSCVYCQLRCHTHWKKVLNPRTVAASTPRSHRAGPGTPHVVLRQFQARVWPCRQPLLPLVVHACRTCSAAIGNQRCMACRIRIA